MHVSTEEHEIIFRFFNKAGIDITDTEAVDGYHFRDFFDCSILTSTLDDLSTYYKGPNCKGVGVRWVSVS